MPSQGEPSSKKPVARAKVPFEKGYSQMNWLKLTRTHRDLAGKLYILLLVLFDTLITFGSSGHFVISVMA